ncbi:MAG: preprotein translocase subunit SecA, partial [Anaerolineae bacterium]|nr:preprotein translocase subunit SecA [Anaerolineae bacterium]
ADITYGTNNEFGFDYLRDNMVQDLSHCVQRELFYAIVDEVDNILIDEARTPLIISGQAEESSDWYTVFARLVPRLRPSSSKEAADGDYVVDEKDRVVTLTESGIEKMQNWLNISNLYSPEHFALTPYLDNALRAHVLYKRDRDYIVRNGEVVIVDEFTGRLMEGRRYSEGLHQAIEAKEGVRVQRESLTLATITFQNYFRMYQKLAGMTGTAETEKEEFGKIYNLDVVVIPTHLPVIRKDYPDLVYKNGRAKFDAVIEEIKDCYRRRQPVLVGTTAIETSEYLSKRLEREGIPHNVLNAKHHEKEAIIIAQAGRPGAVTIATNMAGRGVDILLGGNPEGLARDRLRREGYDLTALPPDVWEKALAEAKAQCAADREIVLQAGGLRVIGTERHEARRIDNQLRGRSGRQGDPGESRFYVALDDDLMRRFGGERVASIMERLGVEDDVPIEHPMISKSIENAQMRVEGYNFDIRKHVLEYDDVVNKQREVIYDQRRRILQATDLRDAVLDMVASQLQRLVQSFAGSEDERDLAGLHAAVGAIMPLPPEMNPKAWQGLSSSQILQQLTDYAEALYDRRAEANGDALWRQLSSEGATLAGLRNSLDPFSLAVYRAIVRQLGAEPDEETAQRPFKALDPDLQAAVRQGIVQGSALFRDRMVLLRALDERWIRHLTDLDNLREGIGLRAIAQVNPLVAFKKEAHEMYTELLSAIESDIVHAIFKVDVVRYQQPAQRAMRTNRTDGDGAGRQPERRGGQQLGRNDPCWCGSGKKYKHCHMRADQERGGPPQPVAPPAGKTQPVGSTGARPGQPTTAGKQPTAAGKQVPRKRRPR